MILTMDASVETRIGNRWLLGPVVLLLSFVVLAESTDRLDISTVYDDALLKEEIYTSADGWRKPPMFESEWRPEKRSQKSRIHFGYDSAYEAMRARDSSYSGDSGPGFGSSRPNTQLRIGF